MRVIAKMVEELQLETMIAELLRYLAVSLIQDPLKHLTFSCESIHWVINFESTQNCYILNVRWVSVPLSRVLAKT